MRKSLYVDKETNDILEKMPAKKQSAFTRTAVKYYYKNKNEIENSEAQKKQSEESPQLEVEIIG